MLGCHVKGHRISVDGTTGPPKPAGPRSFPDRVDQPTILKPSSLLRISSLLLAMRLRSFVRSHGNFAALKITTGSTGGVGESEQCCKSSGRYRRDRHECEQIAEVKSKAWARPRYYREARE